MTVPKLTCPECGTVLRPAKALAPGKKVKCPECGNVFAAREEEEEQPARKSAPAKKAAPEEKSAKKNAAKAPAVKEPPKKKTDDDDEGTYGYIQEEKAEEEEEKKPKINYAPDESVKDLRGPAVEKIMSPSNQLALAGFACGIGWVILLVLILIPALFPLKDEGKPRPVPKLPRGLSAMNPYSEYYTPPPGQVPPAPPPFNVVPSGAAPKMENEDASFFNVFGLNFALMAEFPIFKFLLWLLPLLLLFSLAGIVVYGAIQMQNLESRGWGIAGSIVAMLPLTCSGLVLVSGMVMQYLLSMVIDDPWYILIVLLIIATVEWLGCIASGVWSLMTLMDDDVKAGFEYEPE